MGEAKTIAIIGGGASGLAAAVAASETLRDLEGAGGAAGEVVEEGPASSRCSPNPNDGAACIHLRLVSWSYSSIYCIGEANGWKRRGRSEDDAIIGKQRGLGAGGGGGGWGGSAGRWKARLRARRRDRTGRGGHGGPGRRVRSVRPGGALNSGRATGAATSRMPGPATATIATATHSSARALGIRGARRTGACRPGPRRAPPIPTACWGSSLTTVSCGARRAGGAAARCRTRPRPCSTAPAGGLRRGRVEERVECEIAAVEPPRAEELAVHAAPWPTGAERAGAVIVAVERRHRARTSARGVSLPARRPEPTRGRFATEPLAAASTTSRVRGALEHGVPTAAGWTVRALNDNGFRWAPTRRASRVRRGGRGDVP